MNEKDIPDRDHTLLLVSLEIREFNNNLTSNDKITVLVLRRSANFMQ